MGVLNHSTLLGLMLKVTQSSAGRSASFKPLVARVSKLLACIFITNLVLFI